MTANARHIDIHPGGNGRPRISRAVVHNGIVHLCGVTPDPTGDVRAQTRQVLARIDQLLASAGSDKTKLLTAQVWLSDMRLFGAHNDVWNEWVAQESPPARVCVEAQLWTSGMLVEVMATAYV
jgi:Putative translation initiation inhibitor, yjgF family